MFKLNNWEPLIIVHRGHSFHTEKTLSIVPANAKLLVVGSCGGYYKLPIAIERAPDAHIVSTKQIGTMRVNDPIIKLICEKIRLNQTSLKLTERLQFFQRRNQNLSRF